MCGIAGIMTRDGREAAPAALSALAGALAHRGPDGQGRYAMDGVHLVHTRLSIIDLAHGAQPLVSDDGVALIANAEIYNDLALRRSLAAQRQSIHSFLLVPRSTTWRPARAWPPTNCST